MLDPYRMVFVNLIAGSILLIATLFYVYIFPKKKVNLLYLLVLISLLPLISLLRKGTYESGLLSEHVVVAYSFYNSLTEGILRPLWSAEACSGFGCPLFIFHYQLPFYVPSVFHFLGLSFLSSMKLLMAISFVLSGITMYKWAKEELGKTPGFISAILYLFAPYHLETMHFRFSTGEAVSFIFPPLILLGIKRIAEIRDYKWFVLTPVFVFLLIFSHQVTALAFMPLFFLYIIFCYLRTNPKKALNIIYSVTSLGLGILLAAFYWLPILIEGKYIRIAFDKNVIFQPLWYYLISPLNYHFGLLLQGRNGELYTNVGYAHLLILILTILFILKGRIKKQFRLLSILLIIGFFAYFIMMQEATKPLWVNIPFLYNMLFAWRFLIEIALITALLGGLVVKTVNKTYFTAFICIFTVAITILNWGNRKALPEISDQNFKNAPLYVEKPCLVEGSTPIWVDYCAPWIGKYPSNHLEILSGNASIKEISRSSVKHVYVVDVKTNTVLKENTYYFPGWELISNNIPLTISKKDKRYPGIIVFELKKGLHKIVLEFNPTKDRLIGSFISIFTIMLIVLSFVFRSRLFKK